MNFLFLDTLGYESSLRLSGHHYARLLASRGHRVLSLSAPVTPWHHLSRTHRETIACRMAAHHAGFAPAPGGAIHYVPHAWIPIRNTWPLNTGAAMELAAWGYRRDVLSRLSALDFFPDVVSLQNLVFHPLVREFPGAVLHYRMTDRMDAFSNFPACLIATESRTLNEADIISLTSRQFFEMLTPEQAEKALYTPNGVDVGHFSRPRPRPAPYLGFDSPIAVYVGALRAWFDWELLGETMRRLPDVRFVLVSPDAPPADFRQSPNGTWIPGVPYEEVPAYYQHADVMIIPFIDSPLVAPVNPIKMFESLAAGTPVVAREWAELKKLEAPIRLARGPEEMAAAVRAGIGSAGRDHDAWAPFLARYSWDANLDRLLDRIATCRARKFAAKAKDQSVQNPIRP